MIDCENIPKSIATVISRGMAKLGELQTIYGSEDLANLLEIAVVNSYNERVQHDNNS